MRLFVRLVAHAGSDAKSHTVSLQVFVRRSHSICMMTRQKGVISVYWNLCERSGILLEAGRMLCRVRLTGCFLRTCCFALYAEVLRAGRV